MLVNSLNVFAKNYNQSVANVIGYYLTISLILAVGILVVHIPLVIVNFDDLTIIQYLKLSIAMTFKDVILSFLCVVVVGVFVITSFVFPIVAGVGGISLPVYLITKLTYKRYSLLSDKHNNED